jgi:hypothetical protein
MSDAGATPRSCTAAQQDRLTAAENSPLQQAHSLSCTPAAPLAHNTQQQGGSSTNASSDSTDSSSSHYGTGRPDDGTRACFMAARVVQPGEVITSNYLGYDESRWDGCEDHPLYASRMSGHEELRGIVCCLA